MNARAKSQLSKLIAEVRAGEPGRHLPGRQTVALLTPSVAAQEAAAGNVGRVDITPGWDSPGRMPRSKAMFDVLRSPTSEAADRFERLDMDGGQPAGAGASSRGER